MLVDEGDYRGSRGSVKSARDAVPTFQPVRFPGPLPAPGVPLSRHRALHKSRCGSDVLVRQRQAREKG